MNIEETIKKIEDWLQENNLDMLHGITEAKNSANVLCDANLTSIEEFLNLGKKNGSKIFIMHRSIFESKYLLDELGVDENESNAKVKSQIKSLKKYEGQPDFFSISWISENTLFEYAGTAEWAHEIDEIKNRIIEENDNEPNGYPRKIREKSLPQSKIEEIAKLVAKHPDFFINQYNQDRIWTILSEILEQKEIKESVLGFFDKNRIQSEARSYFDKYLIKDKEKELIEKIAELKDQGLAKVAIRSKLGISPGMLNKYYY